MKNAFWGGLEGYGTGGMGNALCGMACKGKYYESISLRVRASRAA